MHRFALVCALWMVACSGGNDSPATGGAGGGDLGGTPGSGGAGLTDAGGSGATGPSGGTGGVSPPDLTAFLGTWSGERYQQEVPCGQEPTDWRSGGLHGAGLVVEQRTDDTVGIRRCLGSTDNCGLAWWAPAASMHLVDGVLVGATVSTASDEADGCWVDLETYTFVLAGSSFRVIQELGRAPGVVADGVCTDEVSGAATCVSQDIAEYVPLP